MAAARSPLTTSAPGDGDDLDVLDVDAGELDDDRQLGGLVGAEAVDLRAEAVAQAREARHLPELGEELLDLAREAVDVAVARPRPERTPGSRSRRTSRGGRVSTWRADRRRRIRLILRLVAGSLAFLAYVWVAAVRLLPEVKRRKVDPALAGAESVRHH